MRTGEWSQEERTNGQTYKGELDERRGERGEAVREGGASLESVESHSTIDRDVRDKPLGVARHEVPRRRLEGRRERRRAHIRVVCPGVLESVSTKRFQDGFEL